ncbi:hypothetical protein CRENBAI_024555, partial [Crenichthys baileyi]
MHRNGGRLKSRQWFQQEDYAVEVKLNDYLDIVCPHYPQGEVALVDAERYVLYMVEREDYESCKPQSYDQMRWECSHPFAPHAPEKFSEKFQRFTPFTFGKEFQERRDETHFAQSQMASQDFVAKILSVCVRVCMVASMGKNPFAPPKGKECLKLRVDVIAADGSQEARVANKGTARGGVGAGGGAHNPSNRPADDPVAVLPDVQ